MRYGSTSKISARCMFCHLYAFVAFPYMPDGLHEDTYLARIPLSIKATVQALRAPSGGLAARRAPQSAGERC